MDSKLQRRLTIGRLSSGAAESDVALASDEAGSAVEAMDSGVRLMYLANEGDLEGIQELLDSGTAVNFRDIDGRSALHVAACQGRTDVVDLLLRRGAEVDVEDRWGSTVCDKFIAIAVYFMVNVVCLLAILTFQFPLVCFHISSRRKFWIN